ncbi:MAG: Hsp70 family protein [Archangium sp.]|nr:Hsp70 family protein [Archangium sp.]
MARVVGIDLGTTNSLVAVMEDGRPRLIPNAQGHRLTPSVVGLDAEGQVLVGEAARAQLTQHPERTVAEAKRKMGSTETFTLGARSYRPQELGGFVLKRLRDDAERALGEPVKEAVVTVPAYFTDAQRQATRDAGELAGLVVERIINEPTAAALAYGLDRLDAEQHVLVYDLGGGTFDVSVLEMFGGVLDVKASAGNNHLGGADFDLAIVRWLLDAFAAQHGVDLSGDPRALARLKSAAESAKIALSTATVAPVMLPFLATKNGTALSLELELQRSWLEKLIGPLVRSTLEPLQSALKDAKLDKSAISDVVLVGGSSRLPLVHQLLTEFFGTPPRAGVDPEEAVALGAAIQAGLKSGLVSAATGIMITDVAPYTLGVEVMARTGSGTPIGGLFAPIIPRNSTIPVSRTEIYRTTHDGQKAVSIRVFQGEDRFAKNNALLDEYLVEGVPPARAGIEAVAVTFTYDLNGILQVKTRIVSTGKEALLVVDKGSALTPLERQEGRARLEREWAPPPPSAPPAAAAPVATDVLTVAKARLDQLSGPPRASLAAAIAKLEASAEPASLAQAEAALTELLFDLDG